jgi:predicted nucleic acid-binding protein
LFLPDLNILIGAHRSDSSMHARCRDWLREAFAFVDSLLGHPNALLLNPGRDHLSLFEGLCRGADARGDLVTDAYLAALAIETGAVLVSADRDFARFPGLRWSQP